MRRVFASLAFAVGVLFSLGAQAQFQHVVLMCGDPPAPCTNANPLQTTATVASGTFDESMVAIAALPTLAPGTVTPRGSLAGAMYLQPVFSSASGGGTQVDATHGLPVSLLAGTTGGASFTHVAAGQATTTVKSGAGTLLAVILNSAATATNITTIYDNTAASGTVIAIPAATTATVPISISFGPYGIAFATGLTVKTETANGSDMTFVWK